MSKRYSAAIRRTDPNGDVRSTPRKTVHFNGDPQAGNDSQTSHNLAETDPQAYPPVTQSLTILLSYTEGWLRLTPDSDHKTLFLKFKWKTGTYNGHYVMVVVEPHQLRMGLSLLADKVRDVYAVLRRPTKDRAYDS